ncbi:MAG: hypothetical protein ACFFCW_38250 [Candidatus Hodarchaeota archaeon]
MKTCCGYSVLQLTQKTKVEVKVEKKVLNKKRRAPPPGIALGIPQEKVIIEFFAEQQSQPVVSDY